MNTHPISTLAATAGDAPLMLKIIFWLLLILWAIGAIGYPTNTNVVRANSLMIVVLLAILGFYTFGF